MRFLLLVLLAGCLDPHAPFGPHYALVPCLESATDTLWLSPAEADAAECVCDVVRP